MKPAATTDVFLRAQRRRSRGTLLAWSVAVAASALAWRGATELGWVDASGYWGLVPSAVAAWLLVRWVRRVWRLNEQAVAREVDARWELRARLESAVELSGDDSAVAVAQRVDTARQLESKKPTGTAAWLSGIAAALIGLGAVGWENLALKERAQHPQPLPQVVVVTKPARAVPPPPPPPPPEPLRASIAWDSPERQIKAKAVAEIPLVAHARSNKGFRSMVLEVGLNGTRTNSSPLTAAALGNLTQPGEGDVKLSLFLDETGAKPYDIVSYHLQAAANLAPDFPPVFSPLQFVEVAPADAPAGGDERFAADARELLQRLSDLKQAEVQMLEKNFAFSHVVPGGFAIQVASEHATVAATQSQLAQKADEARGLAVRIRAPDLVTADLAEIGPAMMQASAGLAARDSAAAAPGQARALALLADAERTFRQSLEVTNARVAADTPAAPGGGELEAREQTPAGRLEQLTRRQGENNRRLQQLISASVGLPAIATEQAAIARAVEKLASERALVGPVQKTLEAAVKATAEAARQLGLNDTQAGRIPAAEAQALLQHAVEVQESEGRKAASEMLEQVRQELNEAERLSDRAAQQSKQEQIQQQVETEAQRQQRQGSAEAARKLDTLGDKLKTPPASQAPTQPENKPPPPEKEPDPMENAATGANARGAGNPAGVYVAELRPLPGTTASKGSGQATITLKPDKSIAKLDVTLTGLSSKQTHAFLAVGGTSAQGTAVLPLESGSIAGKYWRFEPAGGFSREALVAALESGNLYLEVDTANYPKGELGGQFLAPQRRNGENPNQPPPPNERRPTDYDAELWPVPGATASRATGSAGIRLSEDKALATLNVLFSNLSSVETGAFLKVGGVGTEGTSVFTVGVGRITGKYWRFDPVGNYTRADLVAALESGKLYIEIDTANFPQGELSGQFTRKTAAGAGGAGTGNRIRQNSQALGVAMPTVGPEAGGASGALVAAAVVAAESQLALTPDNSLAQTIRQLKAAANKLSGTADKGSSLSLLETAAQKAQLLSGDPRLAEVAHDIAKAAGENVDGKQPLDAAALKALADHADELVKALEQERPASKRNEWVRRYSPEEIDPDYRKPVEDYFEHLSREGSAR